MLEWAAWPDVTVMRYDWSTSDLDSIIARGRRAGNSFCCVAIMAKSRRGGFDIVKVYSYGPVYLWHYIVMAYTTVAGFDIVKVYSYGPVLLMALYSYGLYDGGGI